MSVNAFQQMKEKMPATKNARTSAYVQCVAHALTAQVPRSALTPANWEVQVFDSKEINAFALPGGKIGVYTGLLKVATTQDQLAAVIGHDISHVLAGHSASRVSTQTIGSTADREGVGQEGYRWVGASSFKKKH